MDVMGARGEKAVAPEKLLVAERERALHSANIGGESPFPSHCFYFNWGFRHQKSTLMN